MRCVQEVSGAKGGTNLVYVYCIGIPLAVLGTASMHAVEAAGMSRNGQAPVPPFAIGASVGRCYMPLYEAPMECAQGAMVRQLSGRGPCHLQQQGVTSPDSQRLLPDTAWCSRQHTCARCMLFSVHMQRLRVGSIAGTPGDLFCAHRCPFVVCRAAHVYTPAAGTHPSPRACMF
jgi:hypothetical protein